MSLIRYRPLASGAQRAVAIRAKRGDRDAVQRLIEANIASIWKSAHYWSRGRLDSFGDFEQAGVCGMLAAIDNFNAEHGASFLTFASWYVRKGMRDYALWLTRTKVTSPTPPAMVPLDSDDCTVELTARNDQTDTIARRTARRALQSLRGHHLAVIVRRYGFCGEPQTLEQVGAELGCSREWVRQLELRAMKSMRMEVGV